MNNKIKNFAEVMDTLRVFPRLFIGIYIYLLYESVTWFMLLKEPGVAQAGLISVIVGAGIGWFGAYVNSGNTNRDKYETTTTTVTKPVSKPKF